MANPHTPAPLPDPGSLRASDADRDRVAALLGEALAEGRLDHDEHGERLEAVYAAKTIGELAPLTADLPGGARPSAPAPNLVGADPNLLASSVGSENIVAVFGAAERKERWLVEPRTNASVLFGGVDLDLREAVLSQSEVVIQCAVIFGGLTLTVPPGVRVRSRVSALFGGVSTAELDNPAAPDAPVVLLTGLCMFGGVSVRTRSREAKK
ncbi:DUF1707 SHOCT-like domain-containing protein [Marinactinospora thermotolerans]|uniref:Cell wall-active antibiotics response 4TMS YvqF n=1 Tax=Marinactinospora thermotolerans DSM 45154 TaxID=1122192 RepID=A0A1T4T1Y6_9ACTN|nr:DUF1707 domain-containing protein [Marinactinospora thermotolerans]SKA34496.1 Cell wall-active antibiotics response 4TMS YvqF [Marinactinospora thermotolerans DSM 45154]